MKNNINYINSLPDFLAMQRVSFCWFVTEGLKEELASFSRITNFSESTEYIIFGEEYSLIKSPYSLLIAQKYYGSYKVQLIIPIEVRNTVMNNVEYQAQFPIISLPLMTIDATFIINGCERVIISQIIRSPGIYFEKNKNQKRKNQFQRKFSRDIHKLRDFLPSGESFLAEFDLCFSIPTFFYVEPEEEDLLYLEEEKPEDRIIEIIDAKWEKWEKNAISYYSISYLKTIQKSSFLAFLQSFKVYRMVANQRTSQSKIKLIQIFLKWGKANFVNYKIYLQFQQLKLLIQYFNFLLKLILKYEFLNFQSNQRNLLADSTEIFEQISPRKANTFLFITSKANLSLAEIAKLILSYDKLMYKLQNFMQLQINYPFILFLDIVSNILFYPNNLLILKKKIFKNSKYP